MWIENSAMAAWFDKSDVYSAFSGVVQTIIKARKSGKWKEGKKEKGKGLYNEQEQILNSNKQ